MHGESLAPLLREPGRATRRAVVTTFERGNTSLRTQNWRYIRYADGSEKLYDHRNDPHEWRNLAGSREHAVRKAALVKELERLLSAWREFSDLIGRRQSARGGGQSPAAPRRTTESLPGTPRTLARRRGRQETRACRHRAR